eukprot:symbB.v1.2.015682.t1/scaffold1179.1/size133475/5
MDKELDALLKLSDSIPSKSSKIRRAINVKTWGVGRATLVLRQLGKEQRGKLVLELLRVLHEDGFKLDVFHYSAAMTAFENCETWIISLALLSEARRESIVANEYMYSSASQGRAAPWQIVLKFVDEMKVARLGNSICQSSVMNVWSRHGQWQVSLGTLQQGSGDCEGLHAAPAHSVTAAMAACEKGDHWQQSLQIFNRSQVTKDEVCLNAALSACSKGSNWQTAIQILSTMQRQRVERGDVSYNSAISACGKAKEWQMAIALCQELISISHLTAPGIWCATTALACEGNWSHALAMLQWALDQPYTVDAALAGIVISIIQESLGSLKALEVLDALRMHWLQSLGPMHEPSPVPGLQEDQILCQRPGLLVINKASGETTESVVENHLGDLRLASRLDAPTSGVLPLASGDCAQRLLQAQFAGRLVRKEYVCLCEGPFLGEKGSFSLINTPLKTTGIDGVNSRTQVSSSGREARTAYVVKERYHLDEATELILLHVRPLTGRTHQIRVHLASLGRPIVGDMVYGNAICACDRLFLHCSKLRLYDLHGHFFTVTAPLPPELQDFLQRLQKKKETYDTPENERPEPEKYVLKQRFVVPSPFLEKEKH